MASILVVDSDAAARTQITSGLRELGHDVSETTNAGSALAAVRSRRPDLMVCDCALPDLEGVELLSDVRRSDELRAMRVLMTSDRDEANDIVLALESGADDFVGKPINMPEFIARVDACLRRPANIYRSRTISAGGITVDNVGHRVTADGANITLAPREYRLLLFLISNQDRVFSRKQLLVHVWDKEASVGPRTVDVHVRRIRSLMEPFGYDKYLQTVRGSGYRFSLSV
ncbi:MAG: winged helix-turn-helix domain-containing protein [Pseudomonadota bacterium]